MDEKAEPRTDEPTLGDRDAVELAHDASAGRAAAEREAAAAGSRRRSLNELLHATAAEWLGVTHGEVLALIDAQHKSRLEEIEVATEATIRKWKLQEREILRKASMQAEEQEERLQAAVKKKEWYAESVFEGTKQALERAREESIASIDQSTLRVDGAEAEARRILRGYRQPAPAVPALERVPGGDHLQDMQGVEDALERLRKCKVAGLFRGPILLVPLMTTTAAGAGAAAALGGASAALTGGGLSVLAAGIAILAMYFMARREVQVPFTDVLERTNTARASLAAARTATELRFRTEMDLAKRTRDSELAATEAKYGPMLTQVTGQLKRINAEIAKRLPHYQAKTLRQRAENIAAADEIAERLRAAAVQRRDAAMAEEDRRHAEVAEEIERYEREITANSCADWSIAQRTVLAAVDRIVSRDRDFPAPWDAIDGGRWTPPSAPPRTIRLGTVRFSLADVPDAIPSRADLAWPAGTPLSWDLPVSLDAPGSMSLLVEAPPERRSEGLSILQAAAARVLAELPPGKARFTFIDPVGLGQSFAGFMHLADDSPALVTDRIWTDARHVEQRLADLTEHMETVIQKYLRNEYPTLEAYNRKAGEIAEPYRFLVIADFPAAISEGAARRLASILQSGARCGVHVLMLRDQRQPLPAGLDEGDLRRATRRVAWATGPDGWAVDDGRIASLRLRPDPAPGDATMLRLTEAVGRAARDASRVEVPFSLVAPADAQRWTLSTARSLRVPIGRSGATRLQYLSLGEGTSQHALIAGKTGSGKSSLLNAMIVNMALWHSPDEVELWLIDFKKGVEFKAYASSGIPHVRAVAVESDREFGLSILQGLDDELRRRGELFRGAGVQNLADWRALQRPEPMPRTLLVVDEFQELFIEDDKVAQDAALLLDRLVRQGRAFGMHAILGSQTLGGAYGIARSTMGQMGVRIALQCTDADSQLILSDDNQAARLLSRPGEAIYNDAGGLIEGNNPFQVVWLGDEERARMLEQARSAPFKGTRPRPIVFEGNQPADPRANGPLERALAGGSGTGNERAPRAWLGDAVSIRDPSSVSLARRPGANLAVIAQAAEAGGGTLAMCIVALAAQLDPSRSRFVILDGMAGGEQPTAALAAVRDAIPHASDGHGVREADAAVLELGQEVARRLAAGTAAAADPPVFLVINGLHRFRSLRRNENDFSLGDGPPSPDKALGAILREGPPVGVHCLLWVDTAANLQRSVDRTTMRDLNFKALFQMSVSDSSMLIDSPAASRLGMHRAILADDDAGTTEKFRPYGMPDQGYLSHVSAALRARWG